MFDAKLPQCCVNCIHFNEVTEGCAKAEGRRPPVEVITFGCEAFEDSDDFRPTPPPKPKPTIKPPHYKPTQPRAIELAHKPRQYFGFDDMDDDIPF